MSLIYLNGGPGDGYSVELDEQSPNNIREDGALVVWDSMYYHDEKRAGVYRRRDEYEYDWVEGGEVLA